MDITTLDILDSGPPPVNVDFLSEVSPTFLAPGATAGAKYQSTIDLCVPGDKTVKAIAEADPPVGGMCMNMITSVITIDPTPAPVGPPISPAPTVSPSPAPTDQCELGLSIECTPPVINGVQPADCNSIPPNNPICEERPFQMMFRYNGNDCSGSFNVQPLSLIHI